MLREARTGAVLDTGVGERIQEIMKRWNQWALTQYVSGRGGLILQVKEYRLFLEWVWGIDGISWECVEF